MLNDSSAKFFISSDNGGVLQVRNRRVVWTEGPLLTIEDVFVTATKRRNGHCTALLLATIAYGKSVNAARIDVDVNEFNETAMSAYGKVGFDRRNPLIDGSTDILMRYWIQDH